MSEANEKAHRNGNCDEQSCKKEKQILPQNGEICNTADLNIVEKLKLNAFCTDEPERYKAVWLFENFIKQSGIHNIYSVAGKGKTWLAWAVAHDLVLANADVKVFIIDGDNPIDLFIERGLNDFALNHRENFHYISLAKDASEPNLQIYGANLFERLASDTGADFTNSVFVFDSVQDFTADADITKDKDTNQIFAQLKSMRKRGATIIFLHHQPKQYDGAENNICKGSTGWINHPDIAYWLSNRTNFYDIQTGCQLFVLQAQKERYKGVRGQAIIVNTGKMASDEQVMEFASYDKYSLDHQEWMTWEIVKEILSIDTQNIGIKQKDFIDKYLAKSKGKERLLKGEIYGINRVITSFLPSQNGKRVIIDRGTDGSGKFVKYKLNKDFR